MTVAVAEAALAALAERLSAAVAGAFVERNRRAPVDIDQEELPRLIPRLEAIEADTTQEPGYTHYRLELLVTGFAAGAGDVAAAQAVSALHAAVVAALAGWTPETAGLGDVAEVGAEFRLYDADESANPAGEFTARFSMLAHTPTGNPYL